MKNYTETLTFKNEVNTLRENGASEDFVKEYTRIYSQFDENGMDIGTDYSNIVLAFQHPIL
jgi:hypothetical protein